MLTNGLLLVGDQSVDGIGVYAYISIHDSVCGVIKVTNNSHSPACAEGLVEMSKLVCDEPKFYVGLLLVIISPPLETPTNSPGVVSKVGLRW